MTNIFSLDSSVLSKWLCNLAFVFSTMAVITAPYNRFIPGSLNCEAIVPKTGKSESAISHSWWFRTYCFLTSRKASKAPRLSNLLMATKSAKSNMSIFSSWVAAPNSGVMTYRDTSLWSMISVSLWPIPEVSKIIRSKPAPLVISTAALTYLESAKLLWRVAKLRI